MLVALFPISPAPTFCLVPSYILFLVLYAVKTLRDGMPRLLQTITHSGASIPSEIEHASCVHEIDPGFYQFNVPDNVLDGTSSIWEHARRDDNILRYSTESDIAGHVKNFLRNVLNACDMDLELSTNLGIRHITPDICVLTMGNRLVGVVEVKKPTPGALLAPTVLGELLDQMLLIQGFYGSGPIIGILTTLDEWLFAWFPEDAEHFATNNNEEAPISSFLTPVKLAASSSSSSSDSPPGQAPSQQRKWSHDVLVDDDGPGASELSPTAGAERRLMTSVVLNAYTDYDAMLQFLYTSFRRMTQVRLSYRPMERRCGFVLHRGNEHGITWHPNTDETIAGLNVSTISGDRYPRTTTGKLLALEDLGRGATGKAWLLCTLSRHPAVCVLKFWNKNSDNVQKRLEDEKKWWDKVYPEYERLTRVEQWSGSYALMMPHFAEIPCERRGEFRGLIEQLLQTRFQNCNLVHPDIAWRNIGFQFIRATQTEAPVIYDLCGLENYIPDKVEHQNWIDKALSKLYPA
jgi:hypothetical protein